MDAVLLKRAEQTNVPWKNGGGMTRALLCWPPGASLTDFRWRLSVATIARNGPFSVFPGYRRSLVLLEGEGMDLDFGDRQQRVDPAHPRIDFAGEARLDCRLLNGPTVDFNLMIGVDQGPAELHLESVSGSWRCGAERGQLCAAYLRSGQMETPLGDLESGDLIYGSELSGSGRAELLCLRLPVK